MPRGRHGLCSVCGVCVHLSVIYVLVCNTLPFCCHLSLPPQFVIRVASHAFHYLSQLVFTAAKNRSTRSHIIFLCMSKLNSTSINFNRDSVIGFVLSITPGNTIRTLIQINQKTGLIHQKHVNLYIIRLYQSRWQTIKFNLDGGTHKNRL